MEEVLAKTYMVFICGDENVCLIVVTLCFLEF